MQLFYNPKNSPLVKSESVSFDGLLIKAGNNEVPDSLKDHPDFQLYLDSKAFVLTETKVEPEPKPKSKESVITLTAEK